MATKVSQHNLNIESHIRIKTTNFCDWHRYIHQSIHLPFFHAFNSLTGSNEFQSTSTNGSSDEFPSTLVFSSAFVIPAAFHLGHFAGTRKRLVIIYRETGAGAILKRHV